MEYRIRALLALFVLIASPLLTASSCASGPPGQAPNEEYAADFCDELLPEAEEQMAQNYQQQQQQQEEPRQTDGGQTERVAASVTGPFGETVDMEVEVETSHTTDTSGSSDPEPEPQPQVVETGLSDIVLNCGSDQFDDRTCAVEVYLDSELIGRGNFQTRGQLPMRCLPAGQRELRILDVTTKDVIYEEVVTLESDREYMGEVVEESPTNTTFDFYAESDLSHGFSMPVQEADRTRNSRPGPSSASDGRSDGPPADVRPMSAANFENLLARIDGATFSSDQRDLIEDALAHNYFTSDQAAELIGRLTSSSDQEELAIEFYPRVVDQRQFHVVIDTIDSSISQDNVREELGL